MLRPLGVSTALACALVVAVSVAGASTPRRAAFTVTLTASLTKNWNVVRSVAGACDQTTRYVGRWRLTLSSRRPSPVRAFRSAPGRRVRFSGALVRALTGTARQRGSATVEIAGPGCPPSIERRDCDEERRGFRAARIAFGSPRIGTLRFRRLQRASGIRSLGGSCLHEPADVREIRTDLDLADGPLSAVDLFARDVPRFFVSGNTEQVTTLDGAVEGTVVEHVRWTLRFRRLR